MDRDREHRPRLPHRRRRRRSALRPVAFAARECRIGTVLQFLLHRALLHLRHRRSAERHCCPVLRHRGGGGVQCRGAGANPCRNRHGAGPRHRVALCLQPQAFRRRHARRRALGECLSSCTHAQSPGHHVAAGRRHPCGKNRISTRGCCR